MSENNKAINELLNSDIVSYIPFEQFENLVYISRGIRGQIWESIWKIQDQSVMLQDFSTIFERDEQSVKIFLNEIEKLAPLPEHPSIQKFFGVSDRVIVKSVHSVKITGICLSAATEDAVIAKTLFGGAMAYIEPAFLQDSNYIRTLSADIYSLAVLLWKISSGHHVFQGLLKKEMIQMTCQIIKGTREEPVEGTPPDYSGLYKQYWNSIPDQRPEIKKVIKSLEGIEKKISRPSK
ncbi:hypothetical protein G9A89_010102 [Geosiphon pyriformis]|nr:hypothetical protein G9A89_010102 [Geosiphon pyriformis]